MNRLGSGSTGRTPNAFGTLTAGGVGESVGSQSSGPNRNCELICSALGAGLGAMIGARAQGGDGDHYHLARLATESRARPAGLEPATHGLEIRCSIRLS